MKECDSPEKGCRWSFQKWNDKMTYFGPNDAIIQSFTKDFYESLVRESIQNSLDAVADSTQPVRVSFLFSKLYNNEYPELFELRRHIKGCLDSHADNQRAEELYSPMMSYLSRAPKSSIDIITVSDSNTTGMKYEEGNPKNTFSAFTKSVGLSVKTSKSSGGSFGFGKAAYFQMSPLRSILVSTMTADGKTYFEGVTRLCTHNLDGIQYTDMGYYDSHDGKPVEGNEIPDSFRRKTPGTSISLLGKYSDAGSVSEMKEELVKSVLRNFWLAIYENKLEVNISNSIIISKTEIGRLVSLYFSSTAKDKNSPRPYFEAYTHIPDKTHLHFSKSMPLLGNVDLFVRLSTEVKKDRIAYIRKPRMLVETKSLGTSYGINALFLCLDENGNELLSNIEDASHSSWSTKGKTGEALASAKAVVSEIDEFVTSCLEDAFSSGGDIEIIDIGIGFSEEDIENLLADLSESNNPFGSVPTGELVPEGGDITTVMSNTSIKSRPEPSRGNVGVQSRGERQSKKVAVTKTIGTGHTQKRSKIKGGAATVGRIQRSATPEEKDQGQPFTLYTPTVYHAPAYKENGGWFHDIILHNEEPLEKVFIDVRIGTEDGDDSVGIKSCSPIGRISSERGVIKFEHLDQGVVKIKVQFDDNQRHTIKLR